MEPIKTTPYDFVFDMKQWRDKLLVYSQSDVYEISKAELIGLTTSVTSIEGKTITISEIQNNAPIYNLSGRKMVNGKSHGIYIINGKKMIKEFKK